MIRTTPDRVVGMLFNPHMSSELKLVKKVIGLDTFNSLKQKFVNEIVDTTSKGPFNGDVIRRNLQKFDSETLSEIFTRDEVKDIVDFATNLDNLSPKILESRLFKRIYNSAPDSLEKVVDIIVKPNNTTNIDVVETVLGKKGLKDLRRGFLAKIFSEQKDGEFSPTNFFQTLNRYGQRTLRRLLDPETYADVIRMGEVSKAVPSAEKVLGNEAKAMGTMITFLGGMAVMVNPLLAVAQILVPTTLGKLYMSRLGRRYLTEGFNLPFDSVRAAEIAGRLTRVLSDIYSDKVANGGDNAKIR
jgi:hypothetical protein